MFGRCSREGGSKLTRSLSRIGPSMPKLTPLSSLADGAVRCLSTCVQRGPLECSCSAGGASNKLHLSSRPRLLQVRDGFGDKGVWRHGFAKTAPRLDTVVGSSAASIDLAWIAEHVVVGVLVIAEPRRVYEYAAAGAQHSSQQRHRGRPHHLVCETAVSVRRRDGGGHLTARSVTYLRSTG